MLLGRAERSGSPASSGGLQPCPEIQLARGAGLYPVSKSVLCWPRRETRTFSIELPRESVNP